MTKETFISETGKTDFPVLTVMQPYAHMLLYGFKNYEYRNWRLPQKYIGEWILIHASRLKTGNLFAVNPKTLEEFIFEIGSCLNLPNHAIIGAVKFDQPTDTDYVKYKFAWPVTDRVEFLPEIPDIKGKLRFWKYKIDLPTQINQQIN